MPNPYAGSGSIVHAPRVVKFSRPWGKNNYNLTGATCSPVTITDKHGNKRTIAPLTHGRVVRLAKRSHKVAMAGKRETAPDLTDEQVDAILTQLHANTQPRAMAFNVHDK